MTGDLVLGIDIGTTGVKTVLLHERRGIIAQANEESVLYSDRPTFAEADPQSWLANAVTTIRRVLAESGAEPDRVRAVATTGMVPAIVCIDASGRPVRRAILQNDARASQEVGALNERLGTTSVLNATGSAITQQSVAPTLMWLRQHEPEVWARTRHVVGSYDYVLMALGAEPHVEQNWAIESGLFTLDCAPFEPMVISAGLDADLFPSPRAPGSPIGTISASFADQTGLSRQALLVVGGADHVLSAYAAGVDRPGDWLIKLGGAGDILTASDRAVVDERVYLDAHPRPGVWLPNGCMATSGSLIRWFQDLVGGTALTDMDDEASRRAPASALCLPYFLGEKSPLHDPELRGVFAGLELGHTRADMYRAVLEGIAFGFRQNAEVFSSMGISLERALVTNGGSTSTLWKTIHANVLDTELFPVVGHPGASLGAAIMAAVGAGILELTDSVRFLRLGEPIIPTARLRDAYAEAYPIWRRLGEATAPVSHALSRRASQ